MTAMEKLRDQEQRFSDAINPAINTWERNRELRRYRAQVRIRIERLELETNR